jgi:SAM-dependent methyltransferase
MTARRELTQVQETWEAFGESDPLWAVLTDPAKRGGRWDPAEFFATGETEIVAVLARLAGLGIHPAGRALDFGCGAGRLTRALTTRFPSVTGVDVAGSMIDVARRLNADRPNATFLVNPRADLALVDTGSIGFMYSRLVFQHMPPRLTLCYVREIGRVLEGGGVAAFQVPREELGRRGLAGVVRRGARAVRDVVDRRPRMGFYAVPSADIRAALEQGGAVLVAELDDPEACDWPSSLYVARKP